MGLSQDESVSDARGGYKFEKNQKWNPRTTTNGTENMTLRKALAKSSNTVTVKVAEMLGDTYDEAVDVMVDYLDNFGLTTVIDSPAVKINDLNFSSLTLGGMIKGVSPLEMASAYGVLANNGVYVEPTIVNKIEFSTDSTEIVKSPKEHKVVSEDVAYVMTDMLRAVVDSNYGTGRRARLSTGMPVSGKTGTTNNEREVWFVGYTPYYVASTFVSDDEGTRGVEGGSGVASSLWSKVMDRIHNTLEVKDFEVPSNIGFKTINLITGDESNIDLDSLSANDELRKQYDKASFIFN
jgi:penicillin-binding protein 1A